MANSHKFAAIVTGDNYPPQSVEWSVIGGIPGTVITSGGELFIDPNETAGILTIVATSTFDAEQSGSAIVTVIEATSTIPTISSVDIIPNIATVNKGDMCSFMAAVTGENNPVQTVTWSVIGGNVAIIDGVVLPPPSPGWDLFLEGGKPGKDAYEVALEEGFIGTKAEWLASLIGKDGKGGEPGKTPTIAVGTTTTVDPAQDASVTATDTETGIELHFNIPRGKDEADGDGGGTGSDTPPRDFTENPIDLLTESTGILPRERIDPAAIFSGDYDDLSNAPTLLSLEDIKAAAIRREKPEPPKKHALLM